MSMQSSLPVEIICKIFGFLGPRDIINLRAVSKQFHDISYLDEIWRNLYTNTRAPCPPGPFPFQSVQFLERTLVRSERLAQSWTTQPIRIVSTTSIRLEKCSSSDPTIIGGRWLIDCESSRKFVAHDIDSQTVPRSRHVLWEHADERIDIWDVCGVTTTDGLVIYIGFCVSMRDPDSLSLGSLSKLLEFRVDGTSGHLYHSLSLDIPVTNFHDARLFKLEGGVGPFIYMHFRKLVFHAETRQFFEIPRSGPSEDLFPLDMHLATKYPIMLFTKTHLLMLYLMFYVQNLDDRTRRMMPISMRAMALPPEPCSTRGDPDTLCITHEGRVDDNGFRTIDIIRGAVVDPIYWTTNIRLLCQTVGSTDGCKLSCIDLTLPKRTTHTRTTLPMRIDTHDVVVTENAISMSAPGFIFCLDDLGDGCARGFWCFRSRDSSSNDEVIRFAIDASGERCRMAVGKRGYPRWAHHNYRSHRSISLDGAKGRLCCGDTNRPRVAEAEIRGLVEFAHVVDID